MRDDAGRRPLRFDDVGDPSGTPVVYLHGGGDSRLSRHPDDSIAASLGVRLLAVDRCGPARRCAIAARVGGVDRGRARRRAVRGRRLVGGRPARARARRGRARAGDARRARRLDAAAGSSSRELPRDVRAAMRLARSRRALRRAGSSGGGGGRRRRRATPRDDAAYARGPGRVVPRRRPVARARARVPRPAVGLRAGRRACAGDAVVGRGRHGVPAADRACVRARGSRTRAAARSTARTSSCSAAGATSSPTCPD